MCAGEIPAREAIEVFSVAWQQHDEDKEAHGRNGKKAKLKQRSLKNF